MTELLLRAFHEAAKLSAEEQTRVARNLLADLRPNATRDDAEEATAESTVLAMGVGGADALADPAEDAVWKDW